MTNSEIFKKSVYDSLDNQVGGKHYRNMKIQPAEFINENKLLFAEGNAIKYICRHQSKGKRQDIEKAIHYLEMILERDYDCRYLYLNHRQNGYHQKVFQTYLSMMKLQLT